MKLSQDEKIIWTLWFQGEERAPEIVARCVNIWREMNPDFTLIFLSEDNIFDYVNRSEFNCIKFDNLAYPPKSDLIRLYLLSRFGGVWVDPTTICVSPLSAWLDLSGADFFAFENPGYDRPVANWFMASKKQGYIALKFYEAFKNYWVGRESYRLVNDRSWLNRYARHPRLQWIWFSLLARIFRVYPYFINHYVFGDLLKKDVLFSTLWSRRSSLSAEPCNMPASLGMASPVSSALEEMILTECPHVLKMSWKGADSSVIFNNKKVAGYVFLKMAGRAL
ncbi:capsular polysaccharide synthesis protein [Alcanivorax sp.]|uniref:capsular polysaccharide synthesis protein n=1 Tax=Alcanivorax sp. TaxID=1872427 RepID=UPI0025C258B1|nr:capsular polysaccharide synthesis protein [Alcanivorax sp.]